MLLRYTPQARLLDGVRMPDPTVALSSAVPRALGVVDARVACSALLWALRSLPVLNLAVLQRSKSV